MLLQTVSRTRFGTAILGLSIVGLSLGCSGVPGSVAEPATAEPARSVACDEPLWDVGEVVVKGDVLKLEHKFRLQNRSNTVAEIRDVHSDCGCLVADSDPRTIKPGEESEINVTLSVFGPPGRFQKTLSVRVLGEAEESIRLTIVGSRAINELLYTSPEVVNVGTMAPNESKISRIVLARYDGSKVNFIALRAGGDVFGFRLAGDPVPLLRDDVHGNTVDCVELPVRLDLHSAPLGPFRTKFLVQTDSSEKSTAELEVPVEGTVVEPNGAWVRSVFVDRLERGEVVERRLASTEGVYDSAVVEAARFEGSEGIHVEFVAGSADDPPNREPRVRISRPADSTVAGLARGTLVLECNSSSAPRESRIDVVVFLPK
jgi:hypothetical protein